MTISIGRLAGIAFGAAVVAIAVWQLGMARTALQIVAVSAVVALLGRPQRKRSVEHDGWKILTAGAVEWTAVVLGVGFVGLLAWIFFFVGSARHDAVFQMQMLQLLIVAFAGMTAFALYTSCMITTRWNDLWIEQDAFGLGKKSIRFADIRRLSPIEWAGTLRIDAVDGTRIYVSLYQNGAMELVDDLKAKLGTAEADDAVEQDN